MLDRLYLLHIGVPERVLSTLLVASQIGFNATGVICDGSSVNCGHGSVENDKNVGVTGGAYQFYSGYGLESPTEGSSYPFLQVLEKLRQYTVSLRLCFPRHAIRKSDR